MWLNILIILGTCAAAVGFGFFIYWIIVKIQKTVRARQSNSARGESQTPLSEFRDNELASPEKPLTKSNNAPDIKKGSDTEAENDNWPNVAPEVSSTTVKKEDDDWLNAGVEEVPTNVYKQRDDDWLNAEDNRSQEDLDKAPSNLPTARHPEIQIQQDGSVINIIVTTSLNKDIEPENEQNNNWLNTDGREIPNSVYRQKDDDWLNAENDQLLETDDGSSLNHPPFNQREIQVKQDGFQLDITVSASKKQDIKSGQTVTNLKIGPPPKDSLRERYQPKEEEITTDETSQLYHGIQDSIPIEPEEETTDQSYQLMDEITVRTVESQEERPQKDRGASHVA
jgi:hypothetical protein